MVVLRAPTTSRAASDSLCQSIAARPKLHPLRILAQEPRKTTFWTVVISMPRSSETPSVARSLHHLQASIIRIRSATRRLRVVALPWLQCQWLLNWAWCKLLIRRVSRVALAMGSRGPRLMGHSHQMCHGRSTDRLAQMLLLSMPAQTLRWMPETPPPPKAGSAS